MSCSWLIHTWVRLESREFCGVLIEVAGEFILFVDIAFNVHEHLNRYML